MRQDRKGQVAKFHTQLPDENSDQLYVVLEIKEDIESTGVDIKALNTELSFPPINTFLLNNLEVVKVYTSNFVGPEATINKDYYSQASGKVVKVSEQKIMYELKKLLKELKQMFG